MRIGIPNILPIIGYIFFGSVSTLMTILFFTNVSTATFGASIFIIIFILLCFAMFGFMCYRFKVVVMTDKSLIVIKPFKFQYQNIRLENINELNWDLWEVFRMGDYRKLNIQIDSGYQTNISDLEFINYDSLEKWLVNKTSLTLNLERKYNIELQQAKLNRWLNIIAIIMLVFFLFLFSIGQNLNNMGLAFQITIGIIIGRLFYRLVKYQQRINKSKLN